MMPSLLRHALLVITLLVGLPGLAQASLGATVQDLALGLEQRLAGLDTRDIQVGDHRWHLHTRHLDSPQPCIVMVHGFTARAAHWFRVARRLPDDRCVIAVDLPGFGASTYMPGASYDPDTQADRLQALLKALPRGNDRVDLIGNSMGGFVIATFALRHPQMTRSLALLDAAGVSSPTPSELRRNIAAGRNGFFAKDMASFRQFYAMTMHQPPFVPGFVLEAVGEQAIARVPRHQAIFDQLNGPRLDARLGEIRVPTLIVWGDKDRLLDVSMVSVWRRIAGSQVTLLKDVGHMPHLEVPALIAERYTSFLQGLH